MIRHSVSVFLPRSTREMLPKLYRYQLRSVAPFELVTQMTQVMLFVAQASSLVPVLNVSRNH